MVVAAERRVERGDAEDEVAGGGDAQRRGGAGGGSEAGELEREAQKEAGGHAGGIHRIKAGVASAAQRDCGRGQDVVG